MGTTEIIRSAIESRLKTLWVDNSNNPRTPIQYPNVKGLVNVDGSIIDRPPTDSAWLQLDILMGPSAIATIGQNGGGQNQCFGTVQLSVMGPKGNGTSALNLLVDYARAIFNRASFSGLLFRASSLPRQIPDDGCFRMIVNTPFDFYESVTF